MKLENVQIEIKNKEHYEAVKKRLQELRKWNWSRPDVVDEQALRKDYETSIGLDEECTTWGPCGYKNITLDDLYEVEKEKVIKERFKVIQGATILKDVSTHQEVVDFIKNQNSGTYEIKKFYEEVEK